jgi:hypothetical protein
MLLLSLNTLAARQATADLARSALPDAPQRHERTRSSPKGPRRSRKIALGGAALFNIRPDAGQGRGLR